MNSTQLNEAVIKVPPALLSNVQLYVSSMIYHDFNVRLNNLKKLDVRVRSPEAVDRIEDLSTAIGMLQQKYGAKLLSDSSYNSILGKQIKLPFDANAFIEELTIKVDNEIQSSIQATEIYLEVTKTGNSAGGAGLIGQNKYIVSVKLSFNPKLNYYENANDIMSTCYHECQHIIQAMVIKAKNKNDKQLNKNYKSGSVDSLENFKDYLSSYIEYGPHLADFIHSVQSVFEVMKLKGMLGDSSTKNKTISTVFNIVVSRSENYKIFLDTLKERSPDMYKKAVKTIYKHISPLYDDIVNNDLNYSMTDLPPSQLDANVNVMNIAMSDLHKTYPGKIRTDSRDNYNINIIILRQDSTEIKIKKEKSTYEVQYSHDGNYINLSLNATQLLSFVDSLSTFDCDDDEIYNIVTMYEVTESDGLDELMQEINEFYSFTDLKDSVNVTENSFKIGDFLMLIQLDPDTNRYEVINADYNFYLNLALTQIQLFLVTIMGTSVDDLSGTIAALKKGGNFLQVMTRLRGV